MKNYTFKVVLQIAKDLISCTRMIKNPFIAYRYLRFGLEPQIGIFSLGKLRFKARKEDWIAIREVLVEDEYSCLEQLFSTAEQPLVLDLGANIGSFALRLFMHTPSAHIVSVEAANDTFQLLKANQESNPTFNWEVLNFGVWRENGPLTLMRRGLSVGHRVVEGSGDDVVQGISLPSLLVNLGWDRIDLIKMDIEGGEEAVIPAAVAVLRRTRFLIIEIHNDRIDSQPIMLALSAIYNYRWQLNERKSSKPLFIMANEPLDFSPQKLLIRE